MIKCAPGALLFSELTKQTITCSNSTIKHLMNVLCYPECVSNKDRNVFTTQSVPTMELFCEIS